MGDDTKEFLDALRASQPLEVWFDAHCCVEQPTSVGVHAVGLDPIDEVLHKALMPLATVPVEYTHCLGPWLQDKIRASGGMKRGSSVSQRGFPSIILISLVLIRGTDDFRLALPGSLRSAGSPRPIG